MLSLSPVAGQLLAFDLSGSALSIVAESFAAMLPAGLSK